MMYFLMSKIVLNWFKLMWDDYACVYVATFTSNASVSLVWIHYVESCCTHARILLTKLQLLWQLGYEPPFFFCVFLWASCWCRELIQQIHFPNFHFSFPVNFRSLCQSFCCLLKRYLPDSGFVSCVVSGSASFPHSGGYKNDVIYTDIHHSYGVILWSGWINLSQTFF